MTEMFLLKIGGKASLIRGRKETGTQFPWQPQSMLDHHLHGRWK